MGISLKDIAEYKNDRDPNNLLGMIETQEKIMDMEMNDLNSRYSILHTRQSLIRCGMSVDESKISVTHRTDTAINIWPHNKYNEGDTFLNALTSLITQVNRQIYFSFPVGAYFNHMETFLKVPAQPEHFFALDPRGYKTWKSGEYLTGYVRGFYAGLSDLPQKMDEYAKLNSVNVTGPIYIIGLLDELCVNDPSLHLWQVSAAVSSGKPRKKK